MQPLIEVTSILEYYDGPDVIEALDQYGHQYLGLAQEPDQLSFKFLVVMVSSRQINRIRRGLVDLRSFLNEISPFGWYVCETDDLEAPIQLSNRKEHPIPDPMLPASDYFINDPSQDHNKAMDEAIARQNFAVHLKVESQDIQRSHKLKLKDYGELILGLNSLLVNTVPSGTPNDVTLDKSKMELDVVTPAAEGSLEIVLEATNHDEDMFEPHLLLVSGFRQIDEAISSSTDVEHIKALSERFGADFAKRILKLYQILLRCEIDFRYSWAEPRFRSGCTTAVPHLKTKNVVDSIRKRGSNLIYERTREVTGRFQRFNRDERTWGLRTESGMIVGKIGKDDLPDKLDGLEVDGKYTFECNERQTFAREWRNEEPTWILLSVKRRFQTSD